MSTVSISPPVSKVSRCPQQRKSPPRKPPSPCLTCGEDRAWVPGQQIGTYEAVCADCAEIIESTTGPERELPTDGGGPDISGTPECRALATITESCRRLAKLIMTFERQHPLGCECPLCRYLIAHKRKGDNRELLALIRTTLHRAGFLVSADLPVDLLIIGEVTPW
ncbi:unnamed protein product [Gemmataceae bacterium]|nr:unnamed protein product [Gemmataceae bacterium]VTT96569.1 unnamed protein product [Gemmataceae bacterium]